MATKDTLKATKPVGTKRPNAWGFHDMLGNVSEMCYDYCLPHTKESKIDPTWPKPDLAAKYFKDARFRVMGGSFESDQRKLRAAAFVGTELEMKANCMGFRFALGFPLRPHLIPKELLLDENEENVPDAKIDKTE